MLTIYEPVLFVKERKKQNFDGTNIMRMFYGTYPVIEGEISSRELMCPKFKKFEDSLNKKFEDSLNKKQR